MAFYPQAQARKRGKEWFSPVDLESGRKMRPSKQVFLFSRSTTPTETVRAKAVSMLFRFVSTAGAGAGLGKLLFWGRTTRRCYGPVGSAPFPQSSLSGFCQPYRVRDSRTCREPDRQGRDDILHPVTLHAVQRMRYISSVNPVSS